MRIIRIIGNIALWLGATLGVLAGAVWGAGQLGVLQPMIVISGSMEPGIMTGDLLLSHPVPTETVEVGDVLSLQSELTGKLVTHRVVAIERDADMWAINMKGDDNDEVDLETYRVGDEVLTPWVQIPQGGKVVSKLMEPAVALPILMSLVALLGLSLLDEQPRKAVRRVIARVRDRDPRIDDLDAELAAVGIDVSRFWDMNELDLQLFALGIDPDDTTRHAPDRADTRHRPEPDDPLSGLRLPPSDGIGLVRAPVNDPPGVAAPYDPLLDAVVDERTPARSG